MTDLLNELQRMAAKVTSTTYIEPSKIDQWQRLFGLSCSQAWEQIQEHRDDLGRSTVSEEHWQMVREEKEADGHDRESYEYSLRYQTGKKSMKVCLQTPPTDNTSYIMKLEPPLETALKMKEVIGLEPSTTSGVGERGSATFSIIDAQSRQKVLDWYRAVCPNFKPTIVRLSKSPKHLCRISRAPFLGIDTTLPQHRAPMIGFTPQPSQEQFPVWYFFYGNLAKSEELQRRLGFEKPPQYVQARVEGAQMRSWRGQYRTLVDAGQECVVEGSAYLIASKDEEDVLRFYETEKYEVVRCNIEMQGGFVPGLVFRFAGGGDELQ